MPTTTQPNDANRDHAVLLHMVCGKIASGKSTLIKALAARPRTVVISEDDWLSRLYPGEILTIDDYVRRSRCLKDVVADHACALLKAEVTVLLDIPFNTVAARAWGLAIAQAAGCGHRLHHLDVSDLVCKSRLRARNALGEHPFQASDDEFERIARYFVPPGIDEGLDVVRYGDDGLRLSEG